MKNGLIWLIVCLVMFGACKKSEPAKQQDTHKKVVLRESSLDYDVLPEIKKAQARLYKSEAGYTISTIDHYEKVKVVAKPVKLKQGKHATRPAKAKVKYITKHWQTRDLTDYNILLAVQNTRTKNKVIDLVKLTAKGAKAPSGYTVSSAKSNGVNTEFLIVCPAGYVVLALRRVVQQGKGWKEVVYTPYTKELNTASVRQAGLNYLQYRFKQAKDDLQKKGVKSLAYGGLIVDHIPDSVAMVLALIEHIDPARFQSGTPIEQLINEALIIDGANQSMAYTYAVSKAGARGLFQFIESTYYSIANLYPLAKLEPDFVKGMNNHFNAAKASLLLFDADLSFLKPDHRKFLKKNPQAMGKYLAAAYNGGAGRAQGAIQDYGPK